MGVVDRIMSISKRLSELGIKLPSPPSAVANYRPWLKSNYLIFVSGQLPFINGTMYYPGVIGSNLTDKDGYEAAKLAALNVLAQLNSAMGTLEDLELLRVEGHISYVTGWENNAEVLNGASDLFAGVLGFQGGHARAVFGHNSLPLGACVELVTIAAITSNQATP